MMWISEDGNAYRDNAIRQFRDRCYDKTPWHGNVPMPTHE